MPAHAEGGFGSGAAERVMSAAGRFTYGQLSSPTVSLSVSLRGKSAKSNDAPKILVGGLPKEIGASL
jgi:hypothetical protein